MMDPARRDDLLTTVDRPSPAKARLLTPREKREQAVRTQRAKRDKAIRVLRLAIRRSDLKLQAVSDKDHGQLSREIDDKERLSFHEMFATWPPVVWRELLALLVVEFGGKSGRVLSFDESA